MSDRKAVNKYYPPEWHPGMGSVNQMRGQHPLRDRARKLHLGILIVRFEMPWHIWCEGCGAHVGRGVRYNAEKSKAGKYYTTTIWQFKMKCHLCPNYIVIETDPKNDDYRVVSGGKRKNESFSAADNETIEVMSDAERQRLETDAMYRIEHGAADRAKAKRAAPAIERLLDLKDRTSRDDYASNSLLRRNFRVQRRALKKQAATDKALLDKSSLDLDLVPENPLDVAQAKATKFGEQALSAVERVGKRKRELKRTSIFDSSPVYAKPSGRVGKLVSTSAKSGLSPTLQALQQRRKAMDRVSVSGQKATGLVRRSGEAVSSAQPVEAAASALLVCADYADEEEEE
eukprot:m.17062 g.17062  ORF g.17062 m.17062 type:complete len:344 (-) comp3565_c0_seq1:30-1061(-)